MLWFNSHRRARGRLSAYIDGELAERHVGALEAHLRACESCARELAGLRLAAAVLAELPDIEAPRSFALAPGQVARPPQHAGRSVSFGLRLSGGALAAALAVLLVLDTGGIVGGGGEESTQGSTISAFGRNASESAGDNPLKSMDGNAPPATGSSSAQGYLTTETPSPEAPGEEDSAAAESPRAAGGGSSGSAGVGGGPAPGSGLPSATPLDSAGVSVPPTATPTATPQPLPPTGDDGENLETQPLEPVDGRPAARAATPTPAPGLRDLAPDPLEPNGTGEGELGTFTTADSDVDSDDGPSALLVAEIVLAVLLGVSLVGIAAATYAERRRG